MRQVNHERGFTVVIDRVPRLRQAVGRAQLLNYPVILAQREQHVGRGRLRLRRDRKRIGPGRQLAVVTLPAVQPGERPFDPVAGAIGWAGIIKGDRHPHAHHEVLVALFGRNELAIPRQNLAVAREHNGRHGKVLILRHRRRHHAGQIEMFSFRLPGSLELVPSVPPAQIFLCVKQGNQSDEASAGKQNSLEIAPATEPASYQPHAEQSRGHGHADHQQEEPRLHPIRKTTPSAGKELRDGQEDKEGRRQQNQPKAHITRAFRQLLPFGVRLFIHKIP